MGRNHLILDLDETLVHSDEMTAEDIERMGREPDYRLDDMVGYYRPYLKQFLKYAFGAFKSVGVWTAGSPDYAESIVDLVFTQQGFPQPAFVLTSEDCVPRMENIGWHRYSKLKYKPLCKVWQMPGYSECNTVILDDRTDTAFQNTQNLILIPAFSVRSPQGPDDDYLKRFIAFSKAADIPNAPDVCKVDKTRWWLVNHQ
jgi:hypothetical protein